MRPSHHTSGIVPPYRAVPDISLPPISDSQIDQHISQALPQGERALMRTIMLQLPENKRYDVIYYALDGTVHANYPALLKTTVVYQPSKFDYRQGIGSDGSSIVLAPTTSIPKALYSCSNVPQSTSTGGYREVASVCNTPYEFTHVFLPCNSNNEIYLHYPLSEGVYIYGGGFSGNGNAVDAGMQFSNTYDDWALFVSVNKHQVSNYTRFQCNQTVSLEFYPLSSQTLVLYGTGYTDSGQFMQISQTYAVSASQGWSDSCGGCVVKRVTSLAQNNFLNFKDGSFAGIDVYANPLIAWSNSLVGYWNGRYPPLYNAATWTNYYTGGYYSYPSNDPSRVIVNFVNGGQETDGLFYHG
ncbi:MAG: hypothetical protein GIW94_08070 [Candidatus Eremiobacteraeota bacterium]|nr:hypothetical protein [Candidatus Eremiobacteraeota bacterium]